MSLPCLWLPAMPSAGTLDIADTRTAAASSLKPFSLSLSKAKPVLSNRKPGNPRKRPHSSLAEDDSETDDTFSKAQLVSAFDHAAGGAIGPNDHNQQKGPLVIQAQKNLDWREESHRRKTKNLLPPELQTARANEVRKNGSVGNDDVPATFGLTLVGAKERDTKGDILLVDASSAENTASCTEKLRSEDDEAMDALLGDHGKSSMLILPSSGNNEERGDAWTQREHEDEAFRSDVASRPEPATLDDYVAVPVDEFGSAMLRGMGWKGPQARDDKSGQVKKPKELARRPALLGIGAKELPDGVEELGAWGKAVKVKRKIEKIYNPVLLKNTVTGEMITEEELEKRKENQKTEEQDANERRDRNFELDTLKGQRKLEAGDDSRRKRHSKREQSRSTERSQNSSSKRDRNRSVERERYKASREDRNRSHEHKRHRLSRRVRSQSPDRSRRDTSRGDRSGSGDRKRSKSHYHDSQSDRDRDENDKRRRHVYKDSDERRFYGSKRRHRDRDRGSEDRDTHRSLKH